MMSPIERYYFLNINDYNYDLKLFWFCRIAENFIEHLHQEADTGKTFDLKK